MADEQRKLHGGGELPPLDEIRPEHMTYVRRVLSRFAGIPLEARADLEQDIFVAVFRSPRSSLDVRAFLFGVTRHHVLDWFRERHSEHRGRVAFSLRHPGCARSAEQEYEEKERRGAIHAALALLPGGLANVLVLVELDGLSMPEAAKVLGIRVNTGYTRLRVARARFRAVLRRLVACRVDGRPPSRPA